MPDIFRSAVFELAVMGLAAAILAVWGYISQRWPIPTAILYAIVAFTCLVILRDRFWVPSDAARVRAWLESSGFSIQDRSRFEPDFSFMYVMTDAEGMPVNVSQRRNTSLVSLEVGLAPPPAEVIARFNALMPEQRARLILAIRAELLKYGIGYRGVETLQPVLIEQLALTRETDETEFLRRVFHVRNAGRLFLVVAPMLMP